MGLDLYVTLHQLKDALDITVTDHDSVLLEALHRASRLISAAAGRSFNPTQAVRYFDGQGTDELWLPETLLEATEVAISNDSGLTYVALSAGSWWGSDGVHWDKTPYQRLVLNGNTSSYGWWPKGRRTIRITGLWGWHDDYAQAWVTSGDTVQDNPSVAASATQITVQASTGADALGLTPRFQTGQLLRVENELVEVTATTTTKITVTRGVNGSTAASHAVGTSIRRWMPYSLVSQSAQTQAARWYKRALQAYADAGANAELGQLIYAKRLDPDVEVMLLEGGLRRVTVG